MRYRPQPCVCLVGLLLGSSILVAPASAQDADPEIPVVAYPALPVTGAAAAAFAPTGWVVEAQAEGDLNKDGAADVAFVLHDTAEANVLANDGLGVPSLDTNPRILAIAFKDPAAGSYRLALANHTLIPRHDSPTVDDPFDSEIGLSVARGAFTIELGYFASAGSWETTRTDLTFRYQNKHFELIGFDRNTTMRNSGETTNVSANYSTRKVEIRTGTIESDEDKLRIRRLPDKSTPTIEKVGSGLEFDPVH